LSHPSTTYLKGIPENSRAAGSSIFLQKDKITPELIQRIQQLNDIAASRKQSLAQMAVAWLLKDERITSVLVGVSSVSQLKDNLIAADNTVFSKVELQAIDSILK
jgi:L-glyceraldehyde 3-phosphate reductase